MLVESCRLMFGFLCMNLLRCGKSYWWVKFGVVWRCKGLDLLVVINVNFCCNLLNFCCMCLSSILFFFVSVIFCVLCWKRCILSKFFSLWMVWLIVLGDSFNLEVVNVKVLVWLVVLKVCNRFRGVFVKSFIYEFFLLGMKWFIEFGYLNRGDMFILE